MPSTPTRIFVAITGACLGAVFLAATTASLVTAGVHIWHHLLELYTWQQAMQLVSTVTGVITVMVLIAGMFGYAYWKADDELDSGEPEPNHLENHTNPTTE